MDSNDLLMEDSRYKFYILQFIEHQKSKYCSTQQLCEFFGLSKFKVDRYLEELSNELYMFESNPKILIDETGEITSFNLDNLILKKIRLYYLEDGKNFQLFSESLINELSIESFSEKYFVSRSRAYVIKRALKKYLQTENITYHIKDFKGDEFQIRSFLYSIYYDFYNGMRFPFDSSIYKQVQRMEKILIFTYQLSLPMTKRIKLTIFLGLFFIRIKNHHSIEKLYLKEYQVPQEVHNFFVTFLKTECLVTEEEQIEKELHYLLLFLYLEDILPISVSTLSIGSVEKQASTWTEEFLTLLEQKIQLPSSSEQVSWERLRTYLLRVNRKWLILHFRESTFITKSQINFFKESYPLFHELLTDFVGRLDRANLFYSEEEKVKIYYDYLFALISCIDIRAIEQKLYICVDFSHGEFYTEYIIQNIRTFQNINIEIERKLSSHTQIYISDFVLDKVSCEQIIWKNPPNADDWEAFGNKLIQLKGTQEHG